MLNDYMFELFAAGFLVILLFYMLDKFLMSKSHKVKSFFLFYILLPILATVILNQQAVYAENILNNPNINYLALVKYLVIYWLGISLIFLLEKIFQSSAFFYCLMILIVLGAIIFVPLIAPDLPNMADSLVDTVNQVLSE